MSRKRKARLDLSSPALDAIHQDNTVRAPEMPAEHRLAEKPVITAERPDPHPERSPSAKEGPGGSKTPRLRKGKGLPRPKRKHLKQPTEPLRLQAVNHPLSFRLGVTDPSVVDAAEVLASEHGADPMVVLKRFVRDAMVELKDHLQSGTLERFSTITGRPKALIVLTSTVRIEREALDALKAHMDPLDLFPASAVLGFALDQLLTELYSR